MNEQEIKQHFIAIDKAIRVFNSDKGFSVNFLSVSDQSVSYERTIRWVNNGCEHLLKVFPVLNFNDEILSWTLYGAVWHDTDKDRYLFDLTPASQVPLIIIATYIQKFLDETYASLINIKKEDIPWVVRLVK